ncbi:MAG TPA: hypothetical protein PKK61_14105 [Defluviitaleaceae bacterium]|nr:hypothetical protein [Defluviitaleaceae bacterium]
MFKKYISHWDFWHIYFNYELPDGTVVHIDSIQATLTAKNEIAEGDTIKEYFYPYEVTVKVTGSTNPQYANKKLSITIAYTPAFAPIIKDDGTFFDEKIVYAIKENQIIVFNNVEWY